MGGVPELVSAMVAFVILRARNAREEERISRREEEFVPFRLPPLPRQGQSTPQSMEEAMPDVAMDTSDHH